LKHHLRIVQVAPRRTRAYVRISLDCLLPIRNPASLIHYYEYTVSITTPMSLDTSLLIIFLSATLLLISMQPIAWVFWGASLVAVGARFCIQCISLLR
jgi:hypothetical protein